MQPVSYRSILIATEIKTVFRSENYMLKWSQLSSVDFMIPIEMFVAESFCWRLFLCEKFVTNMYIINVWSAAQTFIINIDVAVKMDLRITCNLGTDQDWPVSNELCVYQPWPIIYIVPY